MLVSHKWSCKTLTDHRDKPEWLTEMLGLRATDPAATAGVGPGARTTAIWQAALRSVADRLQWENAPREARRRARKGLDESGNREALHDGWVRLR